MLSMTLRRLALTAGLLALDSPVGSAEGVPSIVPTAVGKTGERLREYCRRLAAMDFHGSVLVAKSGAVIFQDAYGLADPRSDLPNTVSTAFSTGSVTKQFTAAAILELESKRKLSVSDPIARYLGPVPEDKQTITIHHLLTHSSGLPPSLGADHEAIGRETLVALAMATPLLFEPGTSYEYSNVGYSLAAAIVEKVSGKPYEEFMKVLWRRAGLTRTGLYSLNLPESEVARSHNAAMGYPSPVDVPAEAWHQQGNGGILSVPLDLYHWYTWLQTDKAISAEARKKMFTPHVREGEMESYYGYGWVIQESSQRGGQVIWHNGGAMPHGWSCALYHYVKDSLIVIVFANKTMQGKQPMDLIAMGMVRLVFDPGAPMPPKVSDSVELDAAALSGSYVLKEGGKLEVSLVDRRLRLVPRGQAAVTAVFPTLSTADPSVSNVQSEELIRAASRGEFEAAGKLMDMPPGRSGAEFVQGWWQKLSAGGTLKAVDIYGTRFGEGAQTHCRLDFEGGSEEVCLYWEQGRCMGVGQSKDFYLEMIPQSAWAFASFNLATGDVAIAEFAERRLLFDTGSSTVKADRVK